MLNGRKSYERVLKDPKQMPTQMEFEAVLYLAARAHEAKTGEEWDYSAPTDFESFANKAGWKRTKKTREGWATSKKVPVLNRRP